MSGIFAPESALMRFLTRIADLMILNLVFIATAIPIVTLGAALTGAELHRHAHREGPVRLHRRATTSARSGGTSARRR